MFIFWKLFASQIFSNMSWYILLLFCKSIFRVIWTWYDVPYDTTHGTLIVLLYCIIVIRSCVLGNESHVSCRRYNLQHLSYELEDIWTCRKTCVVSSPVDPIFPFCIYHIYIILNISIQNTFKICSFSENSLQADFFQKLLKFVHFLKNSL